MGMSGKVFLIATIRHGQTCTRLVVSLLVHACPLSLLLVMYVGGVRGLFDAQRSADDKAFVCLLHISGQERVVDDVKPFVNGLTKLLVHLFDDLIV